MSNFGPCQGFSQATSVISKKKKKKRRDIQWINLKADKSSFSQFFNPFSWSAAKHLNQDQWKSESAQPQMRSHHRNISIFIFSPLLFPAHINRHGFEGSYFGRKKKGEEKKPAREPLTLLIAGLFPLPVVECTQRQLVCEMKFLISHHFVKLQDTVFLTKWRA